MKHFSITVVFSLFVLGALAKEATLELVRSEPCTSSCGRWTPLRLSLAGPVSLPWGNWNVTGLDIGLWNDSAEMDGLEIGLVNTSYRMRGLQIGVVNVTRNAFGLQVGIVNVIRSNDIAFFPVINCYF